MKTVIAAAVAATALLLTACGPSEPIRGTIEELEYKPQKVDRKIVPVYSETCKNVTTRSDGKSSTKRVCTKTKFGTKLKTVVKQYECWEVELTDGREFCVTADVYALLVEGGEYDSSKY